ncbi:MAG: class I SAM-dependent methyltransferase [Pseudomonadota bacterium]
MTDTHVTDELRKIAEQEFHDKRELDRARMGEEEFERVYSNKKWYSITASSRAFVDAWLAEHCDGATVLDFGCGLGGNSLRFARHGAEVYAFDISQESVNTTKKVLVDHGYGGKLHAEVMDGENMTYADDTFDVIVCSGVLHHVDVERAFPELARVLKPTGKIVAMEALGYNPIISLYRRLTPSLRTAWETDHILTHRELKIAKRYFDGLSVHYFHLFSILAVPFRKSRIFKPLLAVLSALDSLVLKIPGVQLMAWQMIFFLSKPKER